MQIANLELAAPFHVVLGNARAQSAEMTLAPGDAEGGPDNRHRDSDQWLFVVSGRGIAVVNGDEHRLSQGTLLLIEQGEAHEIRCTGRTPLRTLNFYTPPAYARTGEELPAGSSSRAIQ